MTISEKSSAKSPWPAVYESIIDACYEAHLSESTAHKVARKALKPWFLPDIVVKRQDDGPFEHINLADAGEEERLAYQILTQCNCLGVNVMDAGLSRRLYLMPEEAWPEKAME